MSKPLCIFHANCADGFAAALAVWLHYGKGNIDFHPGFHGEAPPDVTNREVIIVDFSYKRHVLFDMAKTAKSILLIDHHESAYKDLIVDYKSHLPENLITMFNMNKSGCVLAWEYFHHTPVPTLFLHIQDRDLWQFKLPGTKAISSALFSYDYDFKLWDSFLSEESLVELETEGKTLYRKHMKDVKELIKSSQHRMVIQGFDVPVLNAPYFMSSDAGNIMGVGKPFAACYWFSKDTVIYSLRSSPTGINVSKIAMKYSGGGHEKSAGFSMPVNQFIKEFLNTDEQWKRLAENTMWAQFNKGVNHG